MRVLAIETSCDETAVAVVEKPASGEGIILSNVIYSQLAEHQAFGGVVPEIAARAHLSLLDQLIEQALEEAASGFDQLDGIAVTAGPGLIGGLLTGLMTAKALAAANDLPLYAINHLEGHALTPRLTDNIGYPYLLLLVSGGHSQIVEVRGFGDYHRIATTIDDALGEAFDKTAKLLGLGYPGGPAVEQHAIKGNDKRFDFPRPLTRKGEINFSFAGLKTAVRQTFQNLENPADSDIDDICASFQKAITDVLADRIKKAFKIFSNAHLNLNEKHLVIAGGVGANVAIRDRLSNLCQEQGWQLIAPPLNLCTDNAAMIAWAAIEHMENGSAPSPFSVAPRSRWPLDEKSATMIGSGKRGPKA